MWVKRESCRLPQSPLEDAKTRPSQAVEVRREGSIRDTWKHVKEEAIQANQKVGKKD